MTIIKRDDDPRTLAEIKADREIRLRVEKRHEQKLRKKIRELERDVADFRKREAQFSSKGQAAEKRKDALKELAYNVQSIAGLAKCDATGKKHKKLLEKRRVDKEAEATDSRCPECNKLLPDEICNGFECTCGHVTIHPKFPGDGV